MKTFVLLQRLLPQHLLSRIVGRLAKSRVTAIRRPLIGMFIRVFNVDMSQAERPAASYPSFNDFFTRRLKPTARTIEGRICSPVDGTVSAAGRLEGGRILQAKGLDYSLEKLLGDAGHTCYKSGSFLTAYLAPRDYHRVHTPVAGSLTSARYIPGRLFSVNATTTSLVPDLFAANERLVMHFDTDLGPMGLVMVGAMIVAGIKTVWRDHGYAPGRLETEQFATPQQFDQGAELGYFEMGSTVILLFDRIVEWRVNPGDSIRMGQPLVAD